ncbi:MAG: glycosyl hydrolase family 28-related protein [candidate division KSB1 bacterium]|nr:glycosyl hydrolase family 28-related protein [candidate division KSB1 bacterium]
MIQPRREIRPFLFTIIILLNTTLYGESVYKSRPEDPAAVYLTPENYDVTPDAPADDSDALQAAINAVEEKAKFGIVYIPAGEYQLTRPVHVWKGIRLIGYGQTRPRFVLEPHTSGYEGMKVFI